MSRILKIVLPLVLVIAGALIAVALVKNRSAPDRLPPEVTWPMVRVQRVELQDLRMTVRSQGTVNPRTESALVGFGGAPMLAVSLEGVPLMMVYRTQ